MNQTYTNWELILVDDGSPDNCPAICDHYAAQYDNITVIHQKNSGVSAARNAGIDYAFANGNPDSDWINFIDSDDFVHPMYLEYLYCAATETRLSISSCGFIRTGKSTIDEEPSAQPVYYQISPERYWSQNFTNANVAWGKLYRLSMFEDIRYPVGKTFEDNFTTYKMLFKQPRIAVADAKLYAWYLNDNSITMSEWSPSRIDQMDATEAQVAYFSAHHHPAAARRSAQYLLWGCAKGLKYIHKFSPKYDHLLADMQARRKKAFRLYAQEAGWIMAGCYWLMVTRIAPACRRCLRALKRIRKKLFP